MPVIMYDHVNNYKLNNYLEDTKVSVSFTKLIKNAKIRIKGDIYF